MPTYPAYGVNPPTTAFPEATTTSEPVTSSSAPRWYGADYHHPLPATGAYVDVTGYATLSGLRRGPESCGSRSRGSGRSSNRSLTRSEINEVLRGATSKIVGDLTQDIRDKLEPLIPPQASPTTVGMSPHRVQANHLVAGLTNTLGSLRSRPMPTPAVIPRSRGRGDGPPFPRPREEPERGPPPRRSRRLPQEPWGTSEPAPTRQGAAQIAPSEGGRARTGVVWGATPPIGQNDASDTRFVACPGKAEGRNEAERPPALQAPLGRTYREHGARPPPPSPPPGTRMLRTRPTGGAQPQAR